MLPAQTDAEQRLRSRARWRQALLSGSIVWLAVKAFVSLVSLVAVVLHDGPAATDPDTDPLPRLTVRWDSSAHCIIGTARISSASPATVIFVRAPKSSIQAFFPGFPLLVPRGFGRADPRRVHRR